MTLRRTILFALLLMLGVLGVTTTYTLLSKTADEEFHVHCGMQWWTKGSYTIHPVNPPLARIADAALPYLLDSDKDAEVMTLRDAYLQKAIMMRLGTLPFYVISCLVVFIWSRSLFGADAALWSLALYVSLATVSAHAGLATTDMCYAAMFVWAMFMGVQWLQLPSQKTGVWLGVSLGLAVGAKFSVLVQWPAAMLLIVAAQLGANLYRRRRGEVVAVWPLRMAHALPMVIAAPMAFMVLALIYRFDLSALTEGLSQLRRMNEQGFALWMFGPLHNRGVWYFFPVVFFFKTPLSFMAAVSVAKLRALRHMPGMLPALFPMLAAAGVLLASMPSNINLGVRHVLPLYPLLAVPAGYGLWWLWQCAGWRRLAAAGLLAAQVGGFIYTWPDHVSYFNVLAGRHPEHITLDSDLDWGQGIIQLDNALMALNTDDDKNGKIYLCLRGLHIVDFSVKKLLHVPVEACPSGLVQGWVVVSRSVRVMNPDNFSLLDPYKPVQRIGETMDLYYIPQ
jgi:hypothetical protein